MGILRYRQGQELKNSCCSIEGFSRRHALAAQTHRGCQDTCSLGRDVTSCKKGDSLKKNMQSDTECSAILLLAQRNGEMAPSAAQPHASPFHRTTDICARSSERRTKTPQPAALGVHPRHGVCKAQGNPPHLQHTPMAEHGAVLEPAFLLRRENKACFALLRAI